MTVKFTHGAAGADVLVPLAEAKLAVPSVHHGVVDRPRVRHALDAGHDGSVTLVAAPAGYGKTTAVRDWCADRAGALAWITLDAGDNDPGRLWRYVATAVDRVRPGLGVGALRRLGVAGSPIEAAVDELINGISALGSELVVVLEDLHAVTSEQCLASIDYALGHLATNARVVLLARVDPALRLARLRAAGALVEVRAADLAFTAVEAHELLVELGQLELSAEEIDVLVERTEGWPAALVLAWLWLRTVEDPARAVRSFGGDNRFVAEYLSGEVLAALDEDERAFLHGVAVLGEFTAELCDGVLDRTDSAARLAMLEHSNLFVSRLERGGWFRIHSLFAEYAKAELASLDPGAPTRIHRRAAEWLRSRGLPVQAVEHAAAAGEHELVAQLLVEYHLPLIRSGAGQTLLRWVRTLPDDRIVDHPELAVAAATAAMLVGGSTLEQRRLLQLADRAREGRSERADSYVETAALLVRAVTIDGGVAQAVLDGRRAVALAEADAERDPHRSSHRLRPRAVLRRRAGRGVGGGNADARASGDRADRPESGGRALDARARRDRARAARLRTRPRREGEGGGRPDRHDPKLARRERVRRPRRGACGRGKPRRGRARARLRGALLRRRGSDPAPQLAPRPPRPCPPAPWPARRGRGDAALRAGGARSS